jgi:hypothetical protein
MHGGQSGGQVKGDTNVLLGGITTDELGDLLHDVIDIHGGPFQRASGHERPQLADDLIGGRASA